MPEQITLELFDHLVDLAALELTPEEAAYLRRELNSQLTAIHTLEAIPLDETVKITSHGIPYSNEISPAAREDDWDPCKNPDAILDQAPETEERYIVVPEIPHEELE